MNGDGHRSSCSSLLGHCCLLYLDGTFIFHETWHIDSSQLNNANFYLPSLKPIVSLKNMFYLQSLRHEEGGIRQVSTKRKPNVLLPSHRWWGMLITMMMMSWFGLRASKAQLRLWSHCRCVKVEVELGLKSTRKQPIIGRALSLNDIWRNWSLIFFIRGDMSELPRPHQSHISKRHIHFI